MRIEQAFLNSLSTSGGKRPLDEERVTVLMESIKQLGLQQPIHVWVPNDSESYIVAGRHRAEACRRLGWDTIPCFFVEMDEIDRRRWEISENLHRAELTALEKSEHVAEWIKLTEQASSKATPDSAENAQVAAGANRKPCQSDMVSKGGRGKRSGVNQAARELNISGKTEEAKRINAHRAVTVAGLTDEAKGTAREAGLDNNQSALLAAAKHQEPAAQVTTLKNWKRPKATKPAAPPEEKQMKALMNAWGKASPDVRTEFLKRVTP